MLKEERSSHGAGESKQKNRRRTGGAKALGQGSAACGWKVRSRGRWEGHLPSGDESEHFGLDPSDVAAVEAGFEQREGVDLT